MTQTKSNTRQPVLIGLAALTLPLITACAGVGANYQPIIDGPMAASYHTDIDACRSIAKKRNYVNNDVKNDALIGAILGGLLGLTESGNDGENLIGGALVGGAIGGVGSSFSTRDERKDIVRNCMAGRGYRVVG